LTLLPLISTPQPPIWGLLIERDFEPPIWGAEGLKRDGLGGKNVEIKTELINCLKVN
jgi:hypothetical protein